ncbi:hypothetical protein EV361DRAFT_894896 [Lentinula raphanica]|nr:hypothetical protein EV361DRAFT_894896 [Lentinula raphanica]
MTRPAKVKLRAMFILGVVSSAVLAAPTSVGPSLSFEARSTEAQALQPPEEPSSGDGLHGGHHAYNAPDAPSAVERANVDVPLRVSLSDATGHMSMFPDENFQAGVDHPKGDYLKRGLDNQNVSNTSIEVRLSCTLLTVLYSLSHSRALTHIL